MALIPQVVDAVTTPVVAAGGIGDARGIAAALALGADGVQIGTALLLCPDAVTGEQHRLALAKAAGIAVGDRRDPGGGRGARFAGLHPPLRQSGGRADQACRPRSC